MDNSVASTMPWYRKLFEALKHADAAVEYRFEDYLLERIKVAEARITELEKTSKT